MTRAEYIARLCEKWPNSRLTPCQREALATWLGPSKFIDLLKEDAGRREPQRISRALTAISTWALQGDEEAIRCGRIMQADDDCRDWTGLR